MAMNKYHNQVGDGAGRSLHCYWEMGSRPLREERPRGQMGARILLATCRVWPVGAGGQGEAGSQGGDSDLS